MGYEISDINYIIGFRGGSSERLEAVSNFDAVTPNAAEISIDLLHIDD